MKTKSEKLWMGLGIGAILAGLLAVALWLFFSTDNQDVPIAKKIKQRLIEKTSPRIKEALEDKIKDMVVEASDSLYRISYTTFKINMDSGYVDLKDLRLIPDQKVLKRLIAQKKAPNNVSSVVVPEMRLKGIGFTETDKGRHFAVNSIYARNPSVIINNRIRSYNNKPSDPSALYKAFRLIFNRMAVKNMTISSLDFKYNNRNRGTTDYLRNMDIVINGMKTSPAKNDIGKGRTNITMDYFRLTTPDKFYNIISHNVSLLPANKTLLIGHVSVMPRYSKASFHRVAGFAKDRYHWEFDRITWTGIDVDQFIKTQQLFVDKQTIAKSWMEIYSNYNYPLKEKNRRNAYPQEKFQTIAFDLTFRKTKIIKGDIYYRILARETDSVSTLALTQATTEIDNLTNHSLTKERKPTIQVHSKMKVMNAGVMESWYTFNLKDPAAGFTSYSILGPMDARAFNILSRPLGKIEVRKGRIDKLETYLKMNEYTGTGVVNFYYSDMKIAFLEKDRGKDTLDKKGFLSFVSNAVLPNDNPRKNGEFKKGIVNVKREAWQSFFKIQFDATVDGLSSAMMGVYQKDKGADKNILLKAAKAIAGPDREDKETRRKERKEKREERKKERLNKEADEN
ncbi:hypothetical protein [Desertivirga brevis]|uniref:hypothetical protein n=1 Tax=Desertivirga brevis TaxID=2810310 RepID=UPI001A978991|nr:hypothetical protein [Pedobacter sp. SYSU D00873]